MIARHYLDAFGAEPDGSDAPAIREQALSMLVRAAERAQRIGTPGRAAASFADAAELAVTRRSVEPGPAEGTGELSRGAAALWERAAGAAFIAGQHDLAVEYTPAPPGAATCSSVTPAAGHASRSLPGVPCCRKGATPRPGRSSSRRSTDCASSPTPTPRTRSPGLPTSSSSMGTQTTANGSPPRR